MENGLLGIPSISNRTQAVYLGRPVRFSGVIWPGHFAELFGESLGIVIADLERDDGTHVAEDGVGGRLVQLSQILVRNDQRQAVLARFAED